MENSRHQNSSSYDKFSFPIMPINDQAFDFGFITEGSPISPADNLFCNGKLLPHVFQPVLNSNTGSRTISRTSSLGSKDDSLMSSRSNSTNSRSSSCSARTSTSTEASERRPFNQAKAASKSEAVGMREKYQANRPTVALQYGSSQRWNFITPVPALKHQGSWKRTSNEEAFRAKKKGDEKSSSSAWFGKRLFRSIVSTCKECHAIKSSTTNVDVLQRNLNCTSF